MKHKNNKDKELDAIVEFVRNYTGVSGKTAFSGARRFIIADDPIHGPGDDGAVINVKDQQIIGCGEAISPTFLKNDPYGAGIAAIVANVNDVVAMGGDPRGIVNTVVGPTAITERALDGIYDAAAMYDVPIIGGHLTHSEETYALSAFAIGEAEQILSMANIKPGMALVFVACLRGHLRPDFPFFTSIQQQKSSLGRDVRLLNQVATKGLAFAAKDVSMAGSIGSLAMLLEYTRHGAHVDLSRLPIPEETPLDRWLVSFPTYGFWLATDKDKTDECLTLFKTYDLACAVVGETTKSPEIVLTKNSSRQTVFNLESESITGLWDLADNANKH